MRRILYNASLSAAALLGLAALVLQAQKPASEWKDRADIPEPQLGCASAVVGGELHVLGGAHVTETTAGEHYVYGSSEAHQVYNPATNKWRKGAPIPQKTGWPAVAVYNGKIYLFGGETKGIDTLESDRAFVYDPAKDAWKELAKLPKPRSYAAARAVGDYIYIFGARTLPSDTPDLTTYRYDPAKDNYTRLADMPIPARFITQAAYNGKIYCIQGETVDGEYADGVLRYDIKNDAWARLDLKRPNRAKWTLSQQSASIYAGSKVFILGGKPPDAKRTPAATYFDMDKEQFGTLDPLPTGRCCGVAGVIDGTIYVAGGFWELVHDVRECKVTWAYPIPKELLKTEGCCDRK